MRNWLNRFSRGGEATEAGSRKWFVRRQWLVMATVGMAIILIEVADHSRLHEIHGHRGLLQDAELIREVIMFGLGIPLIGGLLLSMLSRTLFEREQAEKLIDRQRIFSEGLLDAADWKERAGRIVRFPVEFTSAVRSALTLFDQNDQHISLATAWAAGGAASPVVDFEPDYRRCRDCYEMMNGAESVLTCPEVGIVRAERRYCLPLSRGGSLLGVLTFDLPSEEPLGPWQRHTLVDAGPVISQAVEVIRLESAVATGAEAAARERRRIARNLHDTLAQNVSYLRLKLDELNADAPLQEIAAVKQEIERMSRVADEAYAQVRQTLLSFREGDARELAPAIRDLVEKVRARGQVEVEVEIEGETPALAPMARHNVLNICREALSNVEKHAARSNVRLTLTADPDRVEIEISDDGPGFDPEAVCWDQCYGIGIMYERARAAGGTLSVNSGVGRGTRVTLSIPVTGVGAGPAAEEG